VSFHEHRIFGYLAGKLGKIAAAGAFLLLAFLRLDGACRCQRACLETSPRVIKPVSMNVYSTRNRHLL